MKNMKFWRTALVATLVLTVMLSVTGGTIAWFTDEVTSGANVIKSGTLKVEVYYGDGNSKDTQNWENIEETNEPLFNYNLWEPGYVATKGVKIVNAGDLAFKYQLKFLPNAQSTGGFKLEDVIDVYVSEEPINSREDLTTPVATLAELMGEDDAVHGELLAKTDDVVYIALKMQESAGNDYQNLSVGNGFGIELLATQYTYEKDSFNEQYDAEATYPRVVAVYSNDELATAINDGATKIVLGAGSYYMPDAAQGKTLTLVGTKDVVMTIQDDGAPEGDGDYSAQGGNVTFENMKIVVAGTYHAGYVRCVTAYKDCEIEGTLTLYNNATFDDCTFNLPYDYIWAYSADVATFNNCVFNTQGKAILVYEHGGSANQVVNVNNCTFNATQQGLANNNTIHVAAVSVDNSLVTGTYTLNFTGENKVDEDFNGLWQLKEVTGYDYSRLVVNENGKTVSMKSVSTPEELDAALSSSDANVAVTLEAGNYSMPEPNLRGKTLTISGTKDTVIDMTAVDARDQFVTGATMVFDGVTLNFGKANYMGLANTASLTYKNCTINGLQFLYGANVQFENCDFNSNGAEHSVWTYGAQNVSFTDCDFVYGDRSINCYGDNDVTGGKQTVNFKNCTFTTDNASSEGAVEINSSHFSVGIEVNLEGCTAPASGEMAYVSPWDSTYGAKTTINIK